MLKKIITFTFYFLQKFMGYTIIKKIKMKMLSDFIFAHKVVGSQKAHP